MSSRLEHALEMTVVPGLVLGYCAVFYMSAHNLPNMAFAYPRFLILTILGFAALFILGEAIRMLRGAGVAEGEAMAPRDVDFTPDLLIVFALVLAAAWASRWVGLSLSNFALMVVLFMFLLRARIALLIALSVAISALFYAVFVMAFDLPLNRL